MDKGEMLDRLRDGENPLDLSIRKWKDLVEGVPGSDGQYPDNCALCEVYWEKAPVEDSDLYEVFCNECPVKLRTGKDACEDTPFQDYIDHLEECYDCDEGDEGLCSDGLYFARQELEFLESLKNIPETKNGKILRKYGLKVLKDGEADE